MLGHKFIHSDLGVGVVLHFDGKYLDTRFKKRTVRFKMGDPALTEVSKNTVVDFEKEENRRKQGLENLNALQPEPLLQTDLDYLLSVKNVTKVRFSWPPFLDESVRKRFADLGREIPTDARPMNSGSRGGTPMYGLSCEIKVNGKEYLSKVSYGLTLYIEHGFDITYAKK